MVKVFARLKDGEGQDTEAGGVANRAAVADAGPIIEAGAGGHRSCETVRRRESDGASTPRRMFAHSAIGS